MKSNSHSLGISRIGWPLLSLNAAGMVLGIVLGIAAMHFLVLVGNGKYSTETSIWLSTWVKMKRNIALEADSPKLIILGGSNAFYGLRASTLSEELGRPVVNLATHAALPSAFHFHELDRVARSGDVVLFVPEYEKYREGRYLHNTETVPFFVSYSQDYLKSVPLRSYLGMLFSFRATDFFEHFFRDQKRTKRQLKRMYDWHEDIISKDGDYALNRASDITPQGEVVRKNIQPGSLEPLLEIDFHSTETTTDFFQMILSEHERLEDVGVTLLFSWPNMLDAPEHHTARVRSKLEELTDFLNSHGIVVVGDPFSAMLPRKEFFDTNYHLMAQAAEERTARLLLPLRRALSGTDFPMEQFPKK